MTRPALTFDDVAFDPVKAGRARYRAQHGDRHAKQLLEQVDAAWAALSNLVADDIEDPAEGAAP